MPTSGEPLRECRRFTPPIADPVAANLDHYRLNTVYKHGLHFTELPPARTNVEEMELIGREPAPPLSRVRSAALHDRKRVDVRDVSR